MTNNDNTNRVQQSKYSKDKQGLSFEDRFKHIPADRAKKMKSFNEIASQNMDVFIRLKDK